MSHTLDQTALITAFNQAAPHYEEYALLETHIGQQLLNRLQEIKITPDRLLDLGCGTGYWTRELAKHYPHAHLIGVDIAGNMIEQAILRSPDSIQYLCEDAHHTSLPSHSVDCIFSNLLFPWCDPNLLLKECARILKPGGLLLFTSLGPDTLWELQTSWGAIDQPAHTYPFWDMHNLGDLLLANQFELPVVDVEYLKATFSDLLSLLHYLKKTGSYCSYPHSQGLTSLGALKKLTTLYEKHRSTEGYLPATCEVIYGHACLPVSSPLAYRDEEGHVRIPLSTLRKK